MLNWGLLICLTIFSLVLACVTDWVEVFMKGKEDDTKNI